MKANPSARHHGRGLLVIASALLISVPSGLAKKGGGKPGGGGGGGGGGGNPPAISYTVELVPTLAAGQTARANGTNDLGDVIGYMYDDTSEFPLGFFNYVDAAGTSQTISLTDLVDPGIWITNASAINNGRQITGGLVKELGDGTLVYSAYLLSLAVDAAGVTASDLIVFRDLTGTSGTGLGINSAGDVTGYSEMAGGRKQPFKWTDADSTLTFLPLLEGWTTWGRAINDAGTLVGHTNGFWLAFSYTDATGYELMDSLGGRDPVTVARDINNPGVIVGASKVGRQGFYHAIRQVPGGSLQDLGDLGGGFSWAYAVSDAGYVVGMSRKKDGKYTGPAAGFVWLEEFGMVELGTLVTNLGNLTLEYANDISSGSGGFICGETKDGQAYILIPND